jgi:hypothetical protein
MLNLSLPRYWIVFVDFATLTIKLTFTLKDNSFLIFMADHTPSVLVYECNPIRKLFGMHILSKPAYFVLFRFDIH